LLDISLVELLALPAVLTATCAHQQLIAQVVKQDMS
jgi:hypothetical protein